MALARDALWASGKDESVEVNQRALIDKVLARYSGEFTVFRELLQNSDDAQSRAVEIRFETQNFMDRRNGKQTQGEATEGGKKTLPNLKTALVHQWTFKNNGMVFRDEDWSRLKKIAEGNPDEEKIGAFGVGFYSLFSVTEEPFVTSGGQWMGFHWKDKKDQLLARRGQLPSIDEDPWTSFEMTLREAAPMPVAFDFTRFLASSITFMAHLSEVSVYFDDKRLAKLTKASGVPKELSIPRGLQSSSASGIMNVKGIKSTSLNIKAEVMRWVYSSGTQKPQPLSGLKPLKASGQRGFFTSLLTTMSGGATPNRSLAVLPTEPAEEVDPVTVNETSVALSIFSADVDVRLDKKMVTELHRSTKKNPPRQLKYELIYTAKDEYDASKKEDEQQPFITGSIFQGLRADLDGTGSARVFIGHATAQTTGLGGHMAARFIPTVERESIDLVDRSVAIWNRELLFVGGFLARSAYELELTTIQSHWKGARIPGSSVSRPNEVLQAWLQSRALHVLKFFTFYQSTPSPDVSHLLESAFFSCGANHPFLLISTVGVCNASEVRLPDSTFSGFLKQLPVLPEEIMTSAQPMVISLQNRGMVKAITFDDVLKELRSRPLEEEEMIACLRWWVGLNAQGDNLHLISIRAELLHAAVLTIGKSGSADEKIIPLASIKTFINSRGVGSNIPLDSPLPDHLLPVSVSKNFSPDALLSSFPWTELSLVEWLRHVCNPTVAAENVERDITLSAPWAERILNVIVRAWPSLSNQMKLEISSLLKNKTCIPTSGGLKVPEQAYFANANVFHDLPVVTFPSGMIVKGSLERVLQTLGVRKHVDLQVVFNRMIKTNEWTIADLTKYLVAVQSTLTTDEWARLKLTAAFSKEAKPDVVTENGQKPTRYQAKQLYEPLEIFRQLGLPTIDWGTQTKWRGASEEAKFLFELGLLRFPPLNVLIDLCASSDPAVRPIALKYFLDNISARYNDYDPVDFAKTSFIPAFKGSTLRMGTPTEVFSNPDWAAFGLLVIQQSLQHDAATKLKIKQHPPTSTLVSLLEKTPPKDESEARKWFGILAGRISDFSSADLTRLSQLSMVPMKVNSHNGEGNSIIHWLPPNQCFFGGASRARFHSKLFTFVDFGTLANGFLSACGTKHEPSVEEVAQILLSDPHRFYELAGGPNNFLTELRNIAVNSRLISSSTFGRMKKSPILLGSQRKLQSSGERGTSAGDLDDDEWDLQYDLRRPDQIVIADDTNAHQFFGDSLFTAPQEDIIEGFYAQLGCRRLSSLVKEDYKTSGEVKNSRVAADTRALILQRLPLFLYEHTHAKTRVSYSWLNSEANFIVRTFGKLSDASAVAKRFGYGPIQLWLAGNAQVDMYEVATSLNRLLFESPKANDALLFMTILSTDLKALKRRGYNVDRILRQQQAERQAADDAQARATKTTLLSSPSHTMSEESASAPLPSVPMATSNQPLQSKASSSNLDKSPAKPRPASTVMSSLHTFKRKIGSTINPAHSDKAQTSLNTPAIENGSAEPPLPPPKTGAPPIPGPIRPSAQRFANTNPTVTPLSNIASNIDMAIKACRPESGNLLRNRQEMQQVKESLDEGYCDISGRAGDFDLVGEMGKVKVYVSGGVPQPQTFMATKHDSLARFIHIMSFLAQVYELPLTSLHVFYDLEGGLIAFNRNASIFLNLRYFEAWHDVDVCGGSLNKAYISWYFTLAHEIAHNLVQPHNSEHEFYFSAICEEHIMALGKLLSTP